MHALAPVERRHSVDAWLKKVVASILQEADVVHVDRSELWSLLDTLPVAILISTDSACRRIVGNVAAQALLHAQLGANMSQSAAPGELPPFKVYSDGGLVAPDDLPMQRAAATGQRVSDSECEIRFDDGKRIFIAGHCIPIINEQGEPCGSIGAFVDITHRHMRHTQDTLIAREMTHRVKNTVSLIQAVAHGTIRRNLDAEDYAVFEQRLVNLAQAQELVARSVITALTLEELILDSIKGVIGIQLRHVRIDGPSIDLSADVAQSLSMVFHELATNACKYGALKNDGTVQITWVRNDRLVTLSWNESGFCARSPARLGFGSKLIQLVLGSLEAGRFERQFGPDGLIVSLSFVA